MYAEDSEGRKVTAEPKKFGKCPMCKEELRSKCGKLVVWHWSHKSLKDCDSWSEGESQWHMEWKSWFPKEQVEVVVGNHRADIVIGKGIVIELQAQSLRPDELTAREVFYDNMVWLFKISRVDNFLPRLMRVDDLTGRAYLSFRWKHPKRTLWFAKKPVFLDLGSAGIFEIRKLYSQCPCGGWGYKISHVEFLERCGVPYRPFSALENSGFAGRPSLIGDVAESKALNKSAVITL